MLYTPHPPFSPQILFFIQNSLKITPKCLVTNLEVRLFIFASIQFKIFFLWNLATDFVKILFPPLILNGRSIMQESVIQAYGK